MIDKKFFSDFINKIGFLIVISVLAYQFLHFTIFDGILLIYLGLAVFFSWEGRASFFGGIGVLIFTWVMKRTRPEAAGVDRMMLYAWWFIGVGLFLILRSKIEKYRRDWMQKLLLLGIRTSEKFLHGTAITAKGFKAWWFIGVGIFLVLRSQIEKLLSITIKTPEKFWYGTLTAAKGLKFFWYLTLHFYQIFSHRFPLRLQMKITTLVVAFFLLFFATHLTPATILFLLFFVATILFRIDCRFIVALGLLALFATPFLIIAGKTSLAELLAVYAYYCFFIGTIALTLRIRDEKDSFL